MPKVTKPRSCPTEQAESEEFSFKLGLQSILHHHGSDNMYSKSWGQLGKMKRAGFCKGYPDFTVIIPDGNGRPKGLAFVEMKALDGKPSQEQKDWIDALNMIEGVDARICYGSKKALEYIQELIDL